VVDCARGDAASDDGRTPSRPVTESPDPLAVGPLGGRGPGRCSGGYRPPDGVGPPGRRRCSSGFPVCHGPASGREHGSSVGGRSSRSRDGRSSGRTDCSGPSSGGFWRLRCRGNNDRSRCVAGRPGASHCRRPCCAKARRRAIPDRWSCSDQCHFQGWARIVPHGLSIRVERGISVSRRSRRHRSVRTGCDQRRSCGTHAIAGPDGTGPDTCISVPFSDLSPGFE
jgi:hypothetical protein